PNFSTAFADRGITNYDKRDYDAAIDADALVQQKPSYAMNFTGRGSSFENRREGDRIIQDVSQAIRNNQYNAFAAAEMPDAPVREYRSELPKEAPRAAVVEDTTPVKTSGPAHVDTSSGAGIIQVPIPRKRERERRTERHSYYR